MIININSRRYCHYTATAEGAGLDR